jgi:GcrA cell cycle regulator
VSSRNIPWADEKTAQLRKLLDDDMSAAQIGRALGMSRSAVLGKLNRLGLSRPRTPAKPKALRTPRRQFSVNYTAQSTPMPPTAPETFIASAEFDAAIPVEQRRTLMQLNDSICRYPIGDVGSAEFFFCGGDTQDNPPYCRFHSKICFGGFSIQRQPPRPDYRRTA